MKEGSGSKGTRVVGLSGAASARLKILGEVDLKPEEVVPCRPREGEFNRKIKRVNDLSSVLLQVRRLLTSFRVLTAYAKKSLRRETPPCSQDGDDRHRWGRGAAQRAQVMLSLADGLRSSTCLLGAVQQARTSWADQSSRIIMKGLGGRGQYVSSGKLWEGRSWERARKLGATGT